jgi:5'-methylthioadenosine phosphorylase
MDGGPIRRKDKYMNSKPTLAVIGGSGLYQMAGLQDVTELDLMTPFGKPSCPVVVGTLAGHRLAFLARHGIGHFISPSEVNYRANIYALKSIGVERIISISACGSLRDDYAPGDIVVPDQLFDLTRERKRSFFGDGLVAHISVAEPFCSDLSEMLYTAAEATSAPLHKGGTFITIEGPRFSTRAESNVYRSWGMSLIGMTTSPEAFLAREAEMCYAVMAHVTDYDVWHISEQPVTVEIVVEILNRNTRVAFQCVQNLAAALSKERGCSCSHALASAVITRPDAIPPETRQRLSLLVDRYLPTA